MIFLNFRMRKEYAALDLFILFSTHLLGYAERQHPSHTVDQRVFNTTAPYEKLKERAKKL